MAGFGNGAVGVPGQVRIDFQTDEAVFAIHPVIEGPEDIRGPPHILHGEGLVNLLHGLAGLDQAADGLVIVSASRNGLLENRRVGRHPLEAVRIDELFQFPGFDHLPADIIQPDALAKGTQFHQRILAHI